jgi:hypothetical protein
MVPLLSDVLFLVVAMALGGVEGNAGGAAGALVALVVFGNRLDGFGQWLGHERASAVCPEKTPMAPVAFPRTKSERLGG